jgi:hypothetical protein
MQNKKDKGFETFTLNFLLFMIIVIFINISAKIEFPYSIIPSGLAGFIFGWRFL